MLLPWQIFQIFKFGSAILTAVLMAKLFHNLSDIKVYESLQLLGTTLSFFYISGLGQTVIPFYEGEDEQKKKAVFQQLFIILCLLAIATSALILWYGAVFQKSSFSLYLVFSVGALFNIPSFAIEGYFLAEKKQKQMLWWAAITFSLQILCIVVPTILYSLWHGLVASLILAIFKFLYCCRALKIFQFSFNKTLFNQFIRYSLPVVLSFLIGGSYGHINALVVEYKLSDLDFVLYRFGAREFPLFLIIANSFSLVYSGKISEAIGNNSLDAELIQFKKQNTKLLHQLFPVAIVLMLVSKPAFAIFYSPETADSYQVFNLLLLLLLSRVLFPQTLLFGYQKSKVFISASAFELLVGLTLSWLWVKPFGLQGVGWAMVLAFMAEKVYLIVYCYRKNIAFFKHFPIVTYSLYSLALIGAYFLSSVF